MSFFEKFKSALQQKWLEYFQANRSWIVLHSREDVDTPDGGSRPCAYLILGAINAMEPRTRDLMVPFCQLNTDPDKIVEVLGLHFDPEKELVKRSEKTIQAEDAGVIPLLPDSEE